ncbi:hypothetical protein llap_6132 [Limosa lapponica baueri]|uniref:Uncharacterized protein n=1 Tax=Limosa lapponica baueri TaxID=1758121 RepID=A0A2I0UBW8_LIMLA|nr:hypothetical protein llap_6132 [Limosa lapponica baueri]
MKMSVMYAKLWEEKKDERTCKTDSTVKLRMPFPHPQHFKAKVWVQYWDFIPEKTGRVVIGGDLGLPITYYVFANCRIGQVILRAHKDKKTRLMWPANVSMSEEYLYNFYHLAECKGKYEPPTAKQRWELSMKGLEEEEGTKTPSTFSTKAPKFHVPCEHSSRTAEMKALVEGLMAGARPLLALMWLAVGCLAISTFP